MAKKKKTKKPSRGSILRANKAIIRFCVIFFVLLIILAVTFPYLSDRFNPQLTVLMTTTASVIGFVLNIFGMGVAVSGRIISASRLSIDVIGECTGLYEMLIFLAAMIAYPANFKKKLLGAAMGIPLLYLINIVRMVFIVVIGNWSPKTFDFLHLYFWQVAMIIIIVSVWLLWIEKIVKYSKPQ